MDTATAASTIPMTAWEQIAVVCIFILFVGVVLAWFSKQSDKWQRFMLEIDEKWRAFNREQRSENNRAVSEVNAAVTNLTTVTQGLVSEVREMREASGKFYAAFEEHDDQAKKILSHVEQQPSARAPKPRLTK